MPEDTTINKSPADGKRKKMIRIILGVVVGALLGFGYYRFVGCSTGSCPITSNPWISTLYGAVMGALIAGV
jgi:hypothetical protein